MATPSVTLCVLILAVSDIGVLLLISGYNIATEIYIKAFMYHKLRFYNILFLLTFVLSHFLPKKKYSILPKHVKGSVSEVP